jgi:hypothetical protein
MFTRAQFLIAAAAGIGGISPNLVNLAQGLTGGGIDVPGLLYWLGVVIFFVLGAAVALIFSETTHSKAFFLGVSLPAFIAAAQTQHGLSVPVAKPPGQQTSLLSFVSESHAQQAPPAATSPGTAAKEPRTVTIQPMQPCAQCELWFYDPNTNVLEKKLIPNLAQQITVEVPPGATQFGIWNKEINPRLWVLPKDPGVSPEYQFGYDYKALNDLKRGLGDYKVRPYDPRLLRGPVAGANH